MNDDLTHRHYFEGPQGTRCRCGETLDGLNSRIRELETEAERLHEENDILSRACSTWHDSYRKLEEDFYHYQEVLVESSSFAKWCWNQAKRLTAMNKGSPAFDRLRDEGRRVYRLTRAALDNAGGEHDGRD